MSNAPSTRLLEAAWRVVSVRRVVGLVMLASIGMPAASARADSPHEPSIVPSWVLPGAPLRVVEADADGSKPCNEGIRFRARFVAASPESLWIDGSSTDRAIQSTDSGWRSTRLIVRNDLCRVDLWSKKRRMTVTGAFAGLLAGGGLGLLGTAVLGEAETDGVLPAWGLLVGPFVGAIVGSFITVDEWRPLYPDVKLDTRNRSTGWW